MNATNNKPVPLGGGGEEWLEVVRQQVKALRFGVVQITVHESKVVQIEKTEKLRFQQTHPGPTGLREA